MLPDLHSLWVGQRLNWLHQLCITSWLAQGHRAVLWTYEHVEGIPNGVELRNAREILPSSAIIYNRFSGSVALFSNRFRYHVLQRYPVTWLDADILLLKPLAMNPPYLFAWETPESVCNAVLRLPSGSRTLLDLLALTDAHVPTPHWWPVKDRIRQYARGLVGRHELAEDMRWGTFGPQALTETLRRHRLTHHALARDVFYPVRWDETASFYDAKNDLESRLTDLTVSVHLWSTGSLLATPEMIKVRDAPPPAKSWIAGQCAAFGIDCGVG